MSVLTIPQMLVRKAEVIPERVAHDDTRRSITIGEWAAEVDRVAGGLIQNGLNHGDRVFLPVSNDHAVEMAIAVVAVMRAGGIAVPVNTRLSSREMSDYAKLIEPRFAITDLPSSLSAFSFDASWSAEDMPDAPALAPDAGAFSANDDALIMGTSGTTGAIKGVVIKHADITEKFGDGSYFDKHANSTLHALPFTGTGGMQGECLLPLTLGQTCYTQPKFDPAEFIRLVEEKKPTTLFFVPTMLQLILDQPTVADADFSSVRNILTGTAPLQQASVLKVHELWPHLKMANSYGMSEGGVGLSTTSRNSILKPGCVGTLPPHMQVRGDDGKVVGAGEVGEIYGHQATQRRYWRDEAATASGWIDGWTKTGDLGYVDQDGDLILVGRSKELIIRGGYNITPMEIENVLHQHPAVRDAAVVGVKHDVLGEDVAAAVSLCSGTNSTAESIVAYCKEHLAENKVPRTIVILDDLPKNQNAKILKRELKPILESAAESDRRDRSSAQV